MVRWRKEAKFRAWWQEQMNLPHYDRCINEDPTLTDGGRWWCCVRAEWIKKESFARYRYSGRYREVKGRHPAGGSDIAALRRRYQQRRRGRWS